MQTPEIHPRIAAVVVTYNRRALLEGCLNALIRQDRPPDEILVIDNASTDGTGEMLKEKYDGKITHVRMEENLGGSAGFYEGIRLAYEKGYDWIWSMDDDVEPAGDALRALADSPAFNDPSVGLLASLVLDARLPNQNSSFQQFCGVLAACPDSDGWLPVARGHYKQFDSIMNFRLVADKDSLGSPLIPIEAAGFLGVMVRSDAVRSVGLPMKELLIFWDDGEYIYRISRRFKVFLVPSSKVLHRQYCVPPRRLKFLGYEKKGGGIPTAQAWRVYYYFRNEIFVRQKYAKPWLAPLVPVLVLTKAVIAAFLIYDHPFSRCKILLQAGIDGVLGRLGRRVNP
ncbi:MAG: glycosyltransferase family 2 protein [Acidobacteriota bacterium]